MKPKSLLHPLRVAKPAKFRLADCDPDDTRGLDLEKGEAKEMLGADILRLADLQERLYAEHHWAVLVIFQGMDAAGKDSAVKHVMSGVNPQGCSVHSFKAPTAEELGHDFLWRAACRLPERGHIGIFNRSYYEEVLITRVHPDVLERENLPPDLVDAHIWKRRYKAIRAFERGVTDGGTLILKFFLNISKAEQKRRFLERLDEPRKRWKFSMNDVTERKRWASYMDAYEDMIRHTSTSDAPWHVIPADNKWFARLAVAAAIVDALGDLDLKFPDTDPAVLRRMKTVRRALLAEK